MVEISFNLSLHLKFQLISTPSLPSPYPQRWRNFNWRFSLVVGLQTFTSGEALSETINFPSFRYIISYVRDCSGNGLKIEFINKAPRSFYYTLRYDFQIH